MHGSGDPFGLALERGPDVDDARSRAPGEPGGQLAGFDLLRLRSRPAEPGEEQSAGLERPGQKASRQARRLVERWTVDRFGPHGRSSLDVAVRADRRDAIPYAADLHLGATWSGYLRSRNLTPAHRDRRLGRLAPASRLQAFPLVHHVDPE